MQPSPPINAEKPSGPPGDASARYLRLLALAVVVLVTLASLLWNHDHPFGFNWDEAIYFDEMQTDVGYFHEAGIRGLARAWLRVDPARPPAYRVLAAPFALLFGPSPFVLRSVAIFARVLTFMLIYLGVRKIGGQDSAALAVIILALCPDIIFFGTIFYNEYVLYLATAGVCFFVRRCWNRPVNSIGDCLGLGAFLGLGSLAKTSFPALVACFLLLVVFFGAVKWISGPSPQFLLNACFVGEMLALPWWLFNFRTALGFVKSAMNFSRDGMGPPGIGTAIRFISRFLQEGIGLPIGCLCILILFVAILRCFISRSAQGANAPFFATIGLLLAPLPMCVMPLLTHNQVMYHISQSLVLFACGFALLAKSRGWLSSGVRFLVLNGVVFTQLALTLSPAISGLQDRGMRFAWTALRRREQWDWNEFRVLLRAQGIEHPSIAYLGALGPLNPPQIEYPWLAHHEQPPQVQWLWRQEDGNPDMSALVATASSNEVVFTVPDLTAARWHDFQVDNQYNSEFARLMSLRPGFQKPLHLRLGRFHPVDLLVFIRTSVLDR